MQNSSIKYGQLHFAASLGLVFSTFLIMPELSRFFSIIVKMLFDDTKQHHKPYVHVYYNENEAVVAIDGEILGGDLPTPQRKLLLAWLVIHEEELYAAWNKAVQKIPFDKIEPLR